MAQRSSHAHIDEALNNATEGDTIEPQVINEPQAVNGPQAINPLPNAQEEGDPHLVNPNWQAIINSQTRWLDRNRSGVTI